MRVDVCGVCCSVWYVYVFRVCVCVCSSALTWVQVLLGVLDEAGGEVAAAVPLLQHVYYSTLPCLLVCVCMCMSVC